MSEKIYSEQSTSISESKNDIVESSDTIGYPEAHISAYKGGRAVEKQAQGLELI